MILNKREKYSSVSEISTNIFFSVTPVGVYSRPRAQLLLSHICISVLASLSNIDCVAILSHYNDSVSYQYFIFIEFNRSWMFSKQFLPVVITLQALHTNFNFPKWGKYV